MGSPVIMPAIRDLPDLLRDSGLPSYCKTEISDDYVRTVPPDYEHRCGHVGPRPACSLLRTRLYLGSPQAFGCPHTLKQAIHLHLDWEIVLATFSSLVSASEYIRKLERLPQTTDKRPAGGTARPDKVFLGSARQPVRDCASQVRTAKRIMSALRTTEAANGCLHPYLRHSALRKHLL